MRSVCFNFAGGAQQAYVVPRRCNLIGLSHTGAACLVSTSGARVVADMGASTGIIGDVIYYGVAATQVRPTGLQTFYGGETVYVTVSAASAVTLYFDP